MILPTIASKPNKAKQKKEDCYFASFKIGHDVSESKVQSIKMLHQKYLQLLPLDKEQNCSTGEPIFSKLKKQLRTWLRYLEK